MASFDRKGEYIYTGNSKGKVSMTSFIMIIHFFFFESREHYVVVIREKESLGKRKQRAIYRMIE